MRDIERLVREVNGTMDMAGMALTEDDKENLRAVLRGDISYQDMKMKILADYQPNSAEHEQA